MSLELLPETEFFSTALNVKLLYLASPARIVEVARSPHFVVFSSIFGRKPLILCWIVSSIFSSTLFTASFILLADPGWRLAFCRVFLNLWTKTSHTLLFCSSIFPSTYAVRCLLYTTGWKEHSAHPHVRQTGPHT